MVCVGSRQSASCDRAMSLTRHGQMFLQDGDMRDTQRTSRLASETIARGRLIVQSTGPQRAGCIRLRLASYSLQPYSRRPTALGAWLHGLRTPSDMSMSPRVTRRPVGQLDLYCSGYGPGSGAGAVSLALGGGGHSSLHRPFHVRPLP